MFERIDFEYDEPMPEFEPTLQSFHLQKMRNVPATIHWLSALADTIMKEWLHEAYRQEKLQLLQECLGLCSQHAHEDVRMLRDRIQEALQQANHHHHLEHHDLQLQDEVALQDVERVRLLPAALLLCAACDCYPSATRCARATFALTIALLLYLLPSCYLQGEYMTCVRRPIHEFQKKHPMLKLFGLEEKFEWGATPYMVQWSRLTANLTVEEVGAHIYSRYEDYLAVCHEEKVMLLLDTFERFSTKWGPMASFSVGMGGIAALRAQLNHFFHSDAFRLLRFVLICCRHKEASWRNAGGDPTAIAGGEIVEWPAFWTRWNEDVLMMHIRTHAPSQDWTRKTAWLRLQMQMHPDKLVVCLEGECPQVASGCYPFNRVLPYCYPIA